MAKVSQGVVHTVPKDLRAVLSGSSKVLDAWNDLTPLARNEYICWTILVKKDETRADHVSRVKEDMLAGKRRHCCWPGCPHRCPQYCALHVLVSDIRSSQRS